MVAVFLQISVFLITDRLSLGGAERNSPRLLMITVFCQITVAFQEGLSLGASEEEVKQVKRKAEERVLLKRIRRLFEDL